MNQIFKIDLNQAIDEEQEYEKNGLNLANVFIQKPDGSFVNKGYKVQLVLSEDGLLGLGIELIKKAMRIKHGHSTPFQEIEQLIPITATGGDQGRLGICLTNDSCELILNVGDLGTINQQIEKAKKKY